MAVGGQRRRPVRTPQRAKDTELAAGIRTPANHSVELCSKDWLETLNTQAESTVTGYRITVRHLIELAGTVRLVELKVRDVDFALGTLAKRLSTRSVRLLPSSMQPKGERLWPYVAVSMLGGIRTEEARALRWSEADLEAGTVAV